MSPKIGPNDTCPCGSDQEYKKYCQATVMASERHFTPINVKRSPFHQLEGAVINQHLMPYVIRELPEDILERALDAARFVRFCVQLFRKNSVDDFKFAYLLQIC